MTALSNAGTIGPQRKVLCVPTKISDQHVSDSAELQPVIASSAGSGLSKTLNTRSDEPWLRRGST
jgi:hypothetical protein